VNLEQASKNDDSLLRVSAVSKTFQGISALNEVSFEVTSGSIKSLIGPNGAGKTTMLNIISGLLRPTDGNVVFKGVDITTLRSDRISLLGVSRTFQILKLFTANNATVLDNVMVGAHREMNPGICQSLFMRSRSRMLEREIRERALKMLSFVGLETSSCLSPLALSFGNQRMLELARALMTKPALLLLDEPASGLNEVEVEALNDLLRSLQGTGMTILLVEHNMKMVTHISNEIVVLDFGTRIADGRPSEITSKPEVISAYLGEDHLQEEDMKHA